MFTRIYLATIRSNILHIVDVIAIGRKSAGSEALAILGMAMILVEDHSAGQIEYSIHLLKISLRTGKSLSFVARSSFPESISAPAVHVPIFENLCS